MPNNTHYHPEWPSLQQVGVPAWYRDGKFGIFIHWGPYAVPAFGGEWYPRQMYLEGSDEFRHHRETYGPQDVFGYKDFIPLFQRVRLVSYIAKPSWCSATGTTKRAPAAAKSCAHASGSKRAPVNSGIKSL